MATLGTALMGALGHSDEEKMFRPWWDALEDFVIYGLIMLGLIVSPTTIFNGTPLYCTLCRLPGQCGPNSTAEADPGHHVYYVKEFCTQATISRFTQYFPYILLLVAFLLAGIERFFDKIFATGHQITEFHSLLAQSAKSSVITEDSQTSSVEDNIQMVEVRQSFKHGSHFYVSYLLRTLLEFLVALLLSGWLAVYGFIIEDDRVIYCNVHAVMYECSGVPTQFYLYVLLLTLALLVVYMLSTFTTLVWLACPFYGNLARFMGNYQDELRKSAGDPGAGDETEAKALLGELFEIYYDNRDLRLLLDLLAATTGLAPPLKVMSLLDQNFSDQCKPVINSLERLPDIVNGEGDVTMMFSESSLVRNIFSKMSEISVIYTVQIVPRTDKDSVEVVVFDGDPEKTTAIVMNYFRSRLNIIGPPTEDQAAPQKVVKFSGVDSDKNYTVRVSLLLNGKSIATAQKSLKALAKVQQPEIQVEAA